MLARLTLVPLALACACTSSGPAGPDAVADTGAELGTGPCGVFMPDDCKPSISSGADAKVTIGTGELEYMDVTDDETLTWEMGPQGGHHVWISLRMTDMRQSCTLVTIDLDDLDDMVDGGPMSVNHSVILYDFTRDEGGWCTLSGLRMQLDNAGVDVLPGLVGHHIRVSVSLKDQDGAKAVAEKTIVVTGAVN